MNAKRNISVVLMAALIVSLAGNAMATLATRIEFEPICPVTVDVEDIDLFALIMEGGPGQAVMEFHNESQIRSSISRICFEDYGLDRVDDIQSACGIYFRKDRRPANLPGGGALEPDFDTAFSISAAPPPVWHGIRPGEQITVTVDLDPEITYSDILAHLAEGSLRIGMHVIGLCNGSSFSAVNEVPEPSTIGLLGLGGLFLVRRRRA